MKAAAIDIGTNTMLLLIGDIDTDSLQIKTIRDVLRLPRLGKDVDSKSNISDESFDKAIAIIEEYKQKAAEHGVDKIIAAATSFIRDANNRNEFINRVHHQTGIKIEILSGKNEAKWSFWGGISGLNIPETNDKSVCIIDIGGGSTEVSYARLQRKMFRELVRDTNINSCSIDIGSVRLHERFNLNSKEEFGKMQEVLNEELNNIKMPDGDVMLVGVAGTVTTLASIKLGHTSYQADTIDCVEISLNEIEQVFEKISKYNREELLKLGDFMEGREDILITGVMILKTFMHRFDIPKVITSTRGLRYGILIREAIKEKSLNN